MEHSAAEFGRLARVTFVFAGLAALFPLAGFLSDNSAHCIQRRYARENAAVLAQLPEAYVTNAYPCTSLDDDDEAAGRAIIRDTPHLKLIYPPERSTVPVVAQYGQ